MKYSLSELHSLPLFLGMGKGELEDLHEHITLLHKRIKRRFVVVEENESCNKIIIIMQGSFHVKTVSDDHSYSVTELLHAPYVIQPERIFGLTQRYSSTIVTQTPCEMMIIEKQMVMKLMEISLTFRINMLNILATKCQRMGRVVWQKETESIEKRLVKFFTTHVVHPAGSKQFHVKMNDLAREIGCSRLEISQALHVLEEKNLIRMQRGIIEVPVLQQLIMEK